MPDISQSTTTSSTPKLRQPPISIPSVPEPQNYLGDAEKAAGAWCIDRSGKLGVLECPEGMLLGKKEIDTLKVIGQFNNGFIICAMKKVDNTLLYAIDQHSADEAVNYERLKNECACKRQKLLQPLRIYLSEYDKYVASEHKSFLLSHGFILSDDASSILEVPVFDAQAFGKDELDECLWGLKEAGEKKVVFASLRKILASKACRSSTMIGDALSPQKMQGIISGLSRTTRPWTCPHGRPTIMLLHENSSFRYDHPK